jgi:MFS family permease
MKLSQKINLYLPLLLLFIFSDIICDNFIVHSFSHFSSAFQLFLFLFLIGLQIIFGPIQAAFSDLYCRKKSLVISLFFSLVAFVLATIYVQKPVFAMSALAIIIFSKGVLGNTIPLSLAAIADTQKKNLRFSFGIATSAYAFAYLILTFFRQYLSDTQEANSFILILVLIVVLCVVLFKDTRDRRYVQLSKSHSLPMIRSVRVELKSLVERLKNRHLQYGLLSFFLWEISLYSVLLLYVDFNVSKFSNVALAMLCGYFLGVLFLKIFRKISDQDMIKIGYNLSAWSLIPFFLLFPIVKINFLLLASCYFFHTFGNALLGSTLFAMIAKEYPSHEQGKNYGLIESTDTVAFLVSILAIIVTNSFQLHLLYIIGFSYLTVALSWIPYSKFLRTAQKKYS